VTPLLVVLFALTVVLDVAGQTAFKLGLDASDDAPLWHRVATSPMAMAGFAAYTLEIVLWLVVLSRAPLSVAFPLAALSYCGVLATSSFVLGERVSARRWLGASIVTLGVAFVCLSA
jgi:undecaprenyl phosphate-alpha-L-ara4N flippase subunit ArnE